jgi:hypothetical protein
MSLKSPFAWIAALVVGFSVASVAHGQTLKVSHASHVGANPFIEPDRFDPDYQFFAPSQVDPYSGGEEPNVGFYGSYSRMYLNVSRPEGSDSLFSGFDGDFTWGNRLDIGYMTPERIGWMTSVWHIAGPNEYLSINQERLNRRNEDDPSDGLGGDVTDGILPQDRNPRTYDVAASMNVARFTSFEINRVFRRKELHYGGLFEPFIGMRYMKFIDFGQRDNYQRFADDVDGNIDLTTPNVDGPYEVYTTNRSEFENTMLGGQIGFRLSKQTGHWLLSTEFRAFAMQNWQFFRLKAIETQTRYDTDTAGDTGAQVEVNDTTIAIGQTDNAEIVWGGEIRMDATYELTRDINLQGGFVLLDLGKGIGRGLTPFNNSQDVMMVGVSMGFTVNR